MATTQQGPTPEFALAYRELMLQSFSREVETTKKVIAAVPENKREYRPDPHARTAWELAWHLAHSDIQFLDAIADLKFTRDTTEVKDKPNTIAEIVSWYEQHYNRAANRVRALSPQQLLTPIDFAGVFKFPAFLYLAFLNNHSIHHRGALATYLRPMGAKVPSIYGGSYDEPFEAAA